MRELLQKFKVMAGLSSDDPPDSKWISLEKTDKKTGKKVSSRREKIETGVAFPPRDLTRPFLGWVDKRAGT